MNEIYELKRQAKAVNDRYKEECGLLYRNGRTVFPEVEHDQRVRELKLERNTALRAIEERAQELYEAMAPDVDVAEEFAPDVALST